MVIDVHSIMRNLVFSFYIVIVIFGIYHFLWLQHPLFPQNSPKTLGGFHMPPLCVSLIPSSLSKKLHGTLKMISLQNFSISQLYEHDKVIFLVFNDERIGVMPNNKSRYTQRSEHGFTKHKESMDSPTPVNEIHDLPRIIAI